MRRAREREGISFPRLGQITGIPTTTLHNMFQDKVKNPDMGKVALIADALGEPRGPLLALAGLPQEAGSHVSEQRAPEEQAGIGLGQLSHALSALVAERVRELRSGRARAVSPAGGVSDGPDEVSMARLVDLVEQMAADQLSQEHSAAAKRGARNRGVEL